MAEFSVGDKVRIRTNLSSSYAGRTGTILSLDGDGYFYPFSVRLDNVTGGGVGFHADELELVQAAERPQEATERRWSVGDRVQVDTDKRTIWEGATGTVVHTGLRVMKGCDWDIRVKMDTTGDDAHFASGELQAAPVQTNKELWV